MVLRKGVLPIDARLNQFCMKKKNTGVIRREILYFVVRFARQQKIICLILKYTLDFKENIFKMVYKPLGLQTYRFDILFLEDENNRTMIGNIIVFL